MNEWFRWTWYNLTNKPPKSYHPKKKESIIWVRLLILCTGPCFADGWPGWPLCSSRSASISFLTRCRETVKPMPDPSATRLSLGHKHNKGGRTLHLLGSIIGWSFITEINRWLTFLALFETTPSGVQDGPKWPSARRVKHVSGRSDWYFSSRLYTLVPGWISSVIRAHYWFA